LNLIAQPYALFEVAEIDHVLADIDDRRIEWLSPIETTRYLAINSKTRKRQYLAGHLLIRTLANNVSAANNTAWDFRFSSTNQPILYSNTHNSNHLYVSISHSNELVAAAISNTAIGIDIETYAKQRDYLSIANFVFSPEELDILKKCPTESLKDYFYLYWTLKESIGKQAGRGLKPRKSRCETSQRLPENAVAHMHSWECMRYVVALATDSSRKQIQAKGVCKDARHAAWLNKINSSSTTILT
jgi:4'-phosphopantetheinyl transferase